MDKLININTINDIEFTESLLGLIKKQILAMGGSKEEEDIKSSLRNALRNGTRAQLFLLKDSQDNYKGFAFGNICSGIESGGDYLWINELYVDYPFRDMGTASKLIGLIEDWCKSEGIGYVACVTGGNNRAAVGLYKKNGYSIEDILWVDKTI